MTAQRLELGNTETLETQPQSVSDRASELVINSVARYPQSTEGDVIVADRLMDRFEPDARSDTGIGIREMAFIDPDPDFCADKVNKIHDAFHIPYRLTPERAYKRVYGTAAAALEAIRTATVQLSGEYGIQLPGALTQTFIVMEEGMFSGRWSINRTLAVQLEDYLKATPAVHRAVAAEFKAKADNLRAHTKKQQTFAQSLVSTAHGGSTEVNA